MVILHLVVPASESGTHLLWWPWVQQLGFEHRSIAHTWFQEFCLCNAPHADFCFSAQILINLLNPLLLWWQEGNISAVCLPKCLPAKLRQVLEHWCVTTLSGIGLSNYIHSYRSSGNTYAANVSGTEFFFFMSTLLNAKPMLLWSFCLVLTSCGLFPLPRLPCALFHLPFVLFQGCPSTSVMCEYPWNSMVVGTAQRWFRLSEFNLSFIPQEMLFFQTDGDAGELVWGEFASNSSCQKQGIVLNYVFPRCHRSRRWTM